MKFLSGGILATLLVLALPLRAADDNARYLDNGYSLLDKLCNQEKPLDQIMIVKTTPKEVADFAKEVSKTASDDVRLLDQLHDKYPSIKFDDRGLPQVEEDTRKSIGDDKEHLLLFGTKGTAFARALLVTQIEAGTYGTNMCKVLADHETSDARAAVVRKIGDRWGKLRDRAYALLNAQ
jgi:hypothetical protein